MRIEHIVVRNLEKTQGFFMNNVERKSNKI